MRRLAHVGHQLQADGTPHRTRYCIVGYVATEADVPDSAADFDGVPLRFQVAGPRGHG